ncbi:hypothetical protein GF337_07850 [candidate division KSB1 bacterium]|nr:hypothetical protein [candidate division KSB1 bacterium]
MTDKELAEALELFNHKLKNQLHSVGINLDVLRSKLKKKIPAENDLFKHLDLVSEQSQKINDVVFEFMKYSKLSDKDRKKVNLRKKLEGVLK